MSESTKVSESVLAGRVVLGSEAHEFGPVDFLESPEGFPPLG